MCKKDERLSRNSRAWAEHSSEGLGTETSYDGEEISQQKVTRVTCRELRVPG